MSNRKPKNATIAKSANNTTNNTSEVDKGGRPAFYSTPEEMQAKIDEFFDAVKHPTVHGLAYFLGFSDRQSLFDYAKRDGYSCVSRAKLRIAEFYEQALMTRDGARGAEFALTRMGWDDPLKLREVIAKEAPPEQTLNLRSNPFDGLTTEELRKLAAQGDDE